MKMRIFVYNTLLWGAVMGDISYCRNSMIENICVKSCCPLKQIIHVFIVVTTSFCHF